MMEMTRAFKVGLLVFAHLVVPTFVVETRPSPIVVVLTIQAEGSRCCGT